MVPLYSYFSLLNPPLRDNSLLQRTPGLIDWRNISLIASLILVSRGLELSGIFTRLSSYLISVSGGSGRRLAFILLLTIAFSSSIIMNDTAMLIFIPLIVTISKVSEEDLSSLVVLSAIAANIGSALTPIGNPQNIIIWNSYAIPFHSFVLEMLPFVLLWLLLLLFLAYLIFNDKIERKELPPVNINTSFLWTSMILLVGDITFAQGGKALWTFPITFGVFLLIGREVLFGFDWGLLLMFIFIFVDFGEIAHILSSSGVSFPNSGVKLFLTSAFLSQLVSNVPATILLLNEGKDWISLAAGVNIGGTGLIVGSLANLIAIRIGEVETGKFHRYSVPYFLLTLILSIFILHLSISGS